MLIDFTTRITIDPMLYTTTLAIRLCTDNRPDCGVFSGRYGGFSSEEFGLCQPRFSVFEDESLGFFDFVINRPAHQARQHERVVYSYIAVGWTNEIYVNYPETWTINLYEMIDTWFVSVNETRRDGFNLILPDYVPGWFKQTK